MENIIRSGQEYFKNPQIRKGKEAVITIGLTTTLLSLMGTMHITFGILLTTHNLVGNPLKCHGASSSQEEICASNSHFQRIGQAIQGEKTYCFHKMTQWLFFSIGNISPLHIG